MFLFLYGGLTEFYALTVHSPDTCALLLLYNRP